MIGNTANMLIADEIKKMPRQQFRALKRRIAKEIRQQETARFSAKHPSFLGQFLNHDQRRMFMSNRCPKWFSDMVIKARDEAGAA